MFADSEVNAKVNIGAIQSKYSDYVIGHSEILSPSGHV